jgi:hypothetical protein
MRTIPDSLEPKCRLILPLSLTLLGCLSLSTAGVESDAWRATGTFTFQQIPQGGEPRTETGFFRAEVAGCDWRIRTADSEDGLTNNLVRYYEYSQVSGLRYSLTSLGVQPDAVTRNAVISTNTFVAFDLSKVSLLWLGLASHCHLQQHGGNRLAPIWILAPQVVESENALLDIKLTPMAKASPFPRSIEFFAGKKFAVGTDKGLEWIDYPAPYNQGFRCAQYEVTAETQLASRPFPKEFSLTAYCLPLDAFEPRQPHSTNDLPIGWRYTARVDHTELISKPEDLRPSISGAMIVSDTRKKIKDGPDFEYLATAWRKENDSEVTMLETLYRQRVAPVSPTQISSATPIVLLVMLLVTGAFLFFALRKWHPNKTERSN